MENMGGHFRYVDAHEAVDLRYQHGAFGFTSSTGDAYSCYRNTDTFHEACGEQLTNVDSLGGPTLSPSMFSLGSYHDSGSRKSSMGPYAVETPLTSCSTATAQAQVQVSPNTKLLSIYDCPENSATTYLKGNNCSNSIMNMPMMEQGLSSEKSHLPLGDISRGKPSGLLGSFTSELLNDFVTNAPILTPQSSSLFHPKDVLLTHLCDQHPEHVIDDASVQVNQSMLGVRSLSSGLVQGDDSGCNMINGSSVKQVENSISAAVNSLVLESESKENSSISPTQQLSDNELFDGVELDMRLNNFVRDLWDDIAMPVGRKSCSNTSTGFSDRISVMETSLIHGADKVLFSESGLQQLLDDVVGDYVNKASAYGSGAKHDHPISGLTLEHHFSTSVSGPSVYRNQVPSLGLPSINGTSGVLLPHYNPEAIHGSPKDTLSNSNICSWIDDSCSVNTESSVLNQSKKPEEAAKIKKRARPGESTRPRPKDRQQIQDRLKELREIVPNGAKCSIDALLDKTIKHMLFLQSVTKYADKLKQADEPKIISEESGVVLKDNYGGVSGGGATWAYEVAGQTMVCPIIVEDLTPPGQMLVEMLCEDRGLFLEIADIIRGFGLIILKGVMEIRECKIWARFLVEANREVTRMDIFLSLIQLLQQNSCLQSGDLATKIVDKEAPMFPGYHQSPVSIPVSLSDKLQ